MFETVLNSKVKEKIADGVMDKYIKENAPVIVDPSNPQIPGYIYDGKQITKPSDENFVPIKTNSMKISLYKQNLPKDILTSVTSYLKKKYSEKFCKILCLSITGTSDAGTGFEASIRGSDLASCLYIWRPFNEDNSVYLYINWEVIFYVYEDSEDNSNPQKMSDLTIDEDGKYKSNSKTKVEVKQKEGGESLITFSKDELENLVSSDIAEMYLAVKSLGKSDTYPVEVNKSMYTNSDGSIDYQKRASLMSNPYVTKTPTVSPAVKEKVNQTKQQTTEMIKSKTEEVKGEFNKMKGELGSLGQGAKDAAKGAKEAAKGEIIKMKEEYMNNLSELGRVGEQLYSKAKDFVQRFSVDLPVLSVVTTPTGPGVAINAIKVQLSNLRETASDMKSLVDQTETLLSKLRFETLQSVIPEIGVVYSSIKNVIALAKTAMSLVGV